MDEKNEAPEESIPEGDELVEALNQAYRLYQANIRAADELVYRLTKGARGDVPEKELLAIALEALDRCRLPGDA